MNLESSEPAIACRGLTHRYPPRRQARRGSRAAQAQTTPASPPDRSDITALDNVSFTVAPSELFGVLGPNGGGKTTLFRIAATFINPTAGEIDIFGTNVRRDPALVRRRLGVVFQAPSLDPKLTVIENLTHHGHLYGLTGTDLADRARRGLEQFNVSERAGDMVETLSGGLRRRVELAKAMLHEPRLLLMDEPSTGLDPGARFDLWRAIATLRERTGVTVVVTTHLMDEADRCDRLAILDRGRLVGIDTPHNLKARIGGDVITVELRPTASADQALESLRQALAPWNDGESCVRVDQIIRIEKPDGPAHVAAIGALLNDRIQSITVGRPTLDDVFLHLTGHHLAHLAAVNQPTALV